MNKRLQARIDFLNEVPTSEALVKRLRRAKVKGQRKYAVDCPIAVFLSDAGAKVVSAGTVSINFLHGRYREYKGFDTREPVLMFMHEFDKGNYPDLIATR